MRIATGLAGLVWISSAVRVAASSPEDCRGCHPREYAAQVNSRHARALRPIGQTTLPELLVGAPIQERSGLAFEYRARPDSLAVTISKGPDRLEATLTWAFGAGAQAFTPVGMRDGQYFEHRVSYYTVVARPGRTMGHPGDLSRSLDSALGIPQSAETVFRCFNCHATGVKPGPDLSEMIAGVNCERCHGNGKDHVAAASLGGPKDTLRRAIRALSRLDPRQSVLFCAECHRSPAGSNAVLEPEKDDPPSIRYQPIGLMASKCFKQNGKLSCLTCHNPHGDAQKDDTYYSKICLSCHTATQPSGSNCQRLSGQDCLTCHMQRRSPAQFLAFTDHRIRVYR